MTYDNIDEMKNQSIKLYLKGYTMQDIAQKIGCSRNYVSNLIKNSPEIIEKRNKSKIKVIKQKNQKRMSIAISTNFLNKIGISNDINVNEYVDISVDEAEKEIKIKKAE